MLIGDSITESFRTQELLPSRQIINRGIYGDNTSGVLERLENELLKYKPDLVFLLIGTNDLALERTDSEILLNMCRIMNILNEKFPDVYPVWTSILPTRDIENRPNERIDLLNSSIRRLSFEHNHRYFDLNKYFSDTTTGELISDFTIDGLHLSESGYKHWAGIFDSYLDRNGFESAEF